MRPGDSISRQASHKHKQHSSYFQKTLDPLLYIMYSAILVGNHAFFREVTMKGKDIKAYRTSLGMTQEQLAKRFGVAANTVARWERDESIPDGAGMLELAFRGQE